MSFIATMPSTIPTIDGTTQKQSGTPASEVTSAPNALPFVEVGSASGAAYAYADGGGP
jgi:hypothetical protein